MPTPSTDNNLPQGASPTEGGGVQFGLEVADIDARWQVREIGLDEVLNEAPTATITASCSNQALDVSQLLTKSAVVSIERGQQRHKFRGVVYTASKTAVHGGLIVSLQLAPKLALLTQNRDSRIFQDKSVPEVIAAVVSERGEGANVGNQLVGTYPKHEYITQYRESDWDFILRLMGEEGISCSFDHDQEIDTLVLFDQAEGRPTVRQQDEGRVPYAGGGVYVTGREAVTYAAHQEEVGPTAVDVRDHDWTNPKLAVAARERDGDGHMPTVEVFDHHEPQRAHAYRGEQYTKHTVSRQAQLRAELLELDRHLWLMHSNVVSAQPGHVFELTHHPSLDGRYLIVSVGSQGRAMWSAQGSYENSIECVPLRMQHRPPRGRRRPVAFPVTATVVGPSDQEIHTDGHGRSKVQFHWDREGTRDERSSCWLRSTQMWAGAKFGTMFLPRIGMEVMVTFLGGNPDRPVITGCLYNGRNRTPYPLPQNKTRSTIKSSSSLGGRGFNELRFEDEAGSEEVFLHAERDFNEEVGHDHCRTVRRNESIRVGGSQRVGIGGSRTERVHRDDELTVREGDKKIDVELGDMIITVSEGTLLLRHKETYIRMREDWIDLNTGYGARIRLSGQQIDLEAKAINIEAANKVFIKGDNEVDVQSTLIKLNS